VLLQSAARGAAVRKLRGSIEAEAEAKAEKNRKRNLRKREQHRRKAEVTEPEKATAPEAQAQAQSSATFSPVVETVNNVLSSIVAKTAGRWSLW